MLTDIDGNVYKTVKVGNQEWMAENLRVTKYNDGSDIQLVMDSDVWTKLVTPAYCWYDSNLMYNKIKYGALYNWHTIDPSNQKKLTPEGWHVPTNNEWIVSPFEELEIVAEGYRDYDGNYYSFCNYGRCWSATTNGLNAWSYNYYRGNSYLFKMEDYKNCGLSVRLVKD
jgi:hypothetical protein